VEISEENSSDTGLCTLVEYSASMQYMLILTSVVCILFGAYLLTKGIFKTTPKHEATWNPRWCYRAILAGVAERNGDGTSRQELVKNCRIGEPVMLIADPLNKYGRNAITVCRSNGQQLGFIAADFAKNIGIQSSCPQLFNLCECTRYAKSGNAHSELQPFCRRKLEVYVSLKFSYVAADSLYGV
jgi:hypothetical protein